MRLLIYALVLFFPFTTSVFNVDDIRILFFLGGSLKNISSVSLKLPPLLGISYFGAFPEPIDLARHLSSSLVGFYCSVVALVAIG